MTQTLDRRGFLKTMGGLVVATAAGNIVLDVVMRDSSRADAADVLTDSLPMGTPICVTIALDGGNDYLNTLVPVNDPWYFDATYGHGPLALEPASTLALGGTSQYRLHPNLPFLANRWNQRGDVAFVLGVGEQTRQSFSHFDSMSYWQTANVTDATASGWMGRYTDRVRAGSPLATVSLGGLRRDATGETAPTLVVRDTSAFTYAIPSLSPDVFRAGLDSMATLDSSGYLQDAASLLSSTFAVCDRVRGATDASVTGTVTDDLAGQLLQSALLIRAGIPCQTYTVGLGPFDSHDSQETMQTDRFKELDTALSRFFNALNGHPRAKDVFVMITSEFGRQVTANDTGGTDHGQSGMGIFIGGGVYRGIYGDAPTLDPGGPTRPNRLYDALLPPIDFRAMHATALTRLADSATAAAVLDGDYPDLGVFTAPTTPPEDSPPTASFTAKLGWTRTLTVDGRSSSDLEGPIASYAWTFGDGTGATGPTASHRYAKAGTFPVTLTVTDGAGATGRATQLVRVS